MDVDINFSLQRLIFVVDKSIKVRIYGSKFTDCQDLESNDCQSTMSNLIQHARLGGCGGMLPQEIFRKVDALRLLLRPFWDKSRVVVAIWLAEYCIQFLAVHVCIY